MGNKGRRELFGDKTRRPPTNQMSQLKRNTFESFLLTLICGGLCSVLMIIGWVLQDGDVIWARQFLLTLFGR